MQVPDRCCRVSGGQAAIADNPVLPPMLRRQLVSSLCQLTTPSVS
jgi:hypothetical protein